MYGVGFSDIRFTGIFHLAGLIVARSVCTVLVLFMITACSGGDPDEGGIVGSGFSPDIIDPNSDNDPGVVTPGINLRGAVGESALASNNAIKVKSSDGVLSELAIDSASQFSTSVLPGLGPWVLSVQPGTDNSMYAIAYEDGTRNINRFSDLGLRNWFARQSLNIESQFFSARPFTNLPDETQYAESVANVFELVPRVLEAYGVTGEDVISGDYIVNDQVISDQGIDSFLKRNTVIIEQGSVSFLITDPATETQSLTRSTLSLNANLRDNGSSPPTVPAEVKALGGDIDQIVVVWTPSSDDVAVLEYEVLRDGAIVTTTPYPVYIDSGRSAGQSYSYEIVAIDIAGNRSALSSPVFGAPLATADTTAPPVPTLLTRLPATNSTIKLLWEQSNIGDVVRWNLYRGIGASEPVILLRLTSNVAIDSTVTTGQTYCYQVQAVDASGNRSELSEALCATAGDVNTSVNSTGDPLPVWNIPEVESITCNQEFTNAQIQPGITTIQSGCYQVPQSLRVAAAQTLKIAQGTVLKFALAAKLEILEGGTLTIEGTPNAPVVLTGSISSRGYWGGVEFQNTLSPGNVIRGAVIQFGGGGDVLAAISAINGASRFSVVDTLVRFNEKQALSILSDSTIVGEFRGNRITDNDAIGVVPLDLVKSLAGNSDFTGNIEDLLDVPRNIYSNRQITIPDLRVPLSWNGVTITNGSLQIDPGVKLEMVPDSIIDVDGSFNAVGTADNPIMLQGISTTTQPNWGGVSLKGRGDKTFNHVNIVNGGDSSPDSGAISWICRSTDSATLSVDNAEISFSESWGILVSADGTCTAEIGENIIYIDNALGEINFLAP